MGTTAIIVSVGAYGDRDVVLEPIPSGKSHLSLRDLSNARDGWGGTAPDSMLFGGSTSDLVWDDFAAWIEDQEWNDPDAIEILVKDEYADFFEVWRMSADQRLVQVLSGKRAAAQGTEGFTSFEDASSWTLGSFGSSTVDAGSATEQSG